MADIGTRYTDEQREELERRIHEIYQDAEKDITHKLNEHMRKFAIKDQIYQEKLQRGEITPAYYARWKSGQVFIGKMWKQKKADIHETAMNAGKASMDIINRKSIGVFTHNMNTQSYLLEKQFGATVGLNLYDVHTVSRMLRDNPKMLPEWKIDEPKQYIWDEKRVQTAITQGIIQGESLDKIAKRIAVGLCGSDEKRMKLFAQTAMTGAQNAGRVESIREANEMGLETEKGWDATLDKRTRETHRILDGQFVAEDEDFTVNGMHIKYPGDPDAPPELVYNCRCALVGRVKRYASGANYKRRDNTTGENMEYKTYKQWASEKGFWKEPKAKPRQVPIPTQPVPVQQPVFTAPKMPEKSANPVVVRMIEEMDDQGIEKLEVKPLQKELTDDEITRKLCGGDMTGGSCVSLAFSYAANKSGWDVTDYRGGKSKEWFSYNKNNKRIVKLPGMRTESATSKSDFDSANQMLAKVQEGKQYVLITGAHASVVTKKNGQLKYLELQSAYRNGWQDFVTEDDYTLKERFACKSYHKYQTWDLVDGKPKKVWKYWEIESTLTDVDSFKEADGYADLMNYINTEPGKQKKGSAGHEY